MRKLVLAALLATCGLPAWGYPRRNYKNAKGEWVRRPKIYKRHPNIPPTATCRDGSLSFTHTAHGACSHHGGVKR